MKVSGYITEKKEGEEETGISGSSPYVTMYEYDSFGRLSKAETGGKKAEYSYDGNGVRRSKTVEGKTTGYYMAGDQVINETENGALSASNIIAGGIIGRITGGTSYMMLKNDHGDVVGLTANGEVKADYTYSAYGELIADGSNGINNPIRYAGEYNDEETGLIYLRARYYDPGLGRFISEDPVRDGGNWYAYCAGNPVMKVDPSGLAPGDHFSTPEEAAADFGFYQNSKSIEVDEEYAAVIYKEVGQDGSTSYYYDTPRNDLATHEKRRSSFHLTTLDHRVPVAIVHTHGAYDANTGKTYDDFSADGSDSDISKSDKLGLDYYVVTPEGNLKRYKSGSGNIKGDLIRSDMPSDPCIEIHKEMKRTLIWELLKKAFPKITEQEIVDARRDNPESWYDVIIELEGIGE